MTRAKDISKILTDADLSGTLDVTGNTTVNGSIITNTGFSVGNTAILGQEIDVSSGDFTLDVAGDIILDADGGDVAFRDGGVGHLQISNVSNDVKILSLQTDKDLIFSGIDGGSEIEAMRIDMSAGGNVGIGTSSISSSDKLSINGGHARVVNSVAQSGNTLDNSTFSGLIVNNSNDANGDLAGIVMYPTSQYTAAAGVFGVRESQTAAGISFWSGSNTGSERMRIDSSGALLIGKTSSDNTTVGGRFLADGFGSLVRNGNKCLVLNRKTSDGQIIELQRDGTARGSIGIFNGDPFIARSSGNGMRWFSNGLHPCDETGATADNTVSLGTSSGRFDDAYITNGVTTGSDFNDKQNIETLSDAEVRVATACKGLLRKWKWKSAVAEKGDNARTHFGIIAQDLQDAFTAEGLDAGDYAMFMSNTWWEKEISVDAVEADEENGIEAQDAYTYMDEKEEATEGYTERTRLGVRYSELLAFIISAI